MIRFFSCLFFAVAFVLSIVSVHGKLELLLTERKRGNNMLKLLQRYLPMHHKVALIGQAVALALIPIAIIVLTIKSMIDGGDEMLKMSVCAIVATAALLLIDNHYYGRVINDALYCVEQVKTEQESKKG